MKGKSYKLKDIDWKVWAGLNVSILGSVESDDSVVGGLEEFELC